jgi:hypothetical protein
MLEIYVEHGILYLTNILVITQEHRYNFKTVRMAPIICATFWPCTNYTIKSVQMLKQMTKPRKRTNETADEGEGVSPSSRLLGFCPFIRYAQTL